MTASGLLDPKLDLVFRMLFSRLENRPLLVSLLNAILSPAQPITKVEVLESELPKQAVGDKGIVLDVRTWLADGAQVDVEMQTQPRPARRERPLFYWARTYGGQLQRGQQYQSF
jgi:predicted transposase/invertase (TIGR01784 family)